MASALSGVESSWSPRLSVFSPCSGGPQRVSAEISAGTANQGTFRRLFSSHGVHNGVDEIDAFSIIARNSWFHHEVFKAPGAAVVSILKDLVRETSKTRAGPVWDLHSTPTLKPSLSPLHGRDDRHGYECVICAPERQGGGAIPGNPVARSPVLLCL